MYDDTDFLNMNAATEMVGHDVNAMLFIDTMVGRALNERRIEKMVDREIMMAYHRDRIEDEIIRDALSWD
jgi:hypothetical protein